MQIVRSESSTFSISRLIPARKRGKSRPILHLINNNLNSTVIAATQSAFAEMNKPDVSAALKNALKLSGVGPATASYVLAAYAPRKVPVFSDEGFRWVMFNSEEGKGGRGWDRKLKYDEKEFKTYVEAATALGERLDVTIDEVEKVGFVLGKETAMAGKGPGKTDPATGASKMGLNTSKKRKPGGLAELHSSSTEMKETVKKLRRTGVTKNQPQTQKHDTGAGASIASSGRNLRVRKLMQ
jgi:hypothetical protein